MMHKFRFLANSNYFCSFLNIVANNWLNNIPSYIYKIPMSCYMCLDIPKSTDLCNSVRNVQEYNRRRLLSYGRTLCLYKT